MRGMGGWGREAYEVRGDLPTTLYSSADPTKPLKFPTSPFQHLPPPTGLSIHTWGDPLTKGTPSCAAATA